MRRPIQLLLLVCLAACSSEEGGSVAPGGGGSDGVGGTGGAGGTGAGEAGAGGGTGGEAGEGCGAAFCVTTHDGTRAVGEEPAFLTVDVLGGRVFEFDTGSKWGGGWFGMVYPDERWDPAAEVELVVRSDFTADDSRGVLQAPSGALLDGAVRFGLLPFGRFEGEFRDREGTTVLTFQGSYEVGCFIQHRDAAEGEHWFVRDFDNSSPFCSQWVSRLP